MSDQQKGDGVQEQVDVRHQHPGSAPQARGTGDADIDAALAELDAVRDQSLEAHIAAAERVQRHLQSRLSDLGD